MTSIRHAEPGDLPALTAIYNHYIRETPITFDTEALSVEARAVWMQQFDTSGPYQLLVAERDGVPIGYACSHRFRERAAYDTSAETSVYLAPDATGGGVGALLYSELLQRLEAGPLHRAFAGVTLPNDASVKLHLRAGFREIGVFREAGYKMGRYWDVAWFERGL